jgi:hypothetical protein
VEESDGGALTIRARKHTSLRQPALEVEVGADLQCDPHPVDSSTTVPAAPGRRCVMEFYPAIAREEIRLRAALFVTVVGTRPSVTPSEVILEVAQIYDLPESSFTIHKAWPEDFMLVFQDEDTAVRVFDNGRVLHCPDFELKFKKWSRFAHSTGVSLPVLVDVELCGIPAHAWSKSTVDKMLGESCWISELSSETVAKCDLSSFTSETFASSTLPLSHCCQKGRALMVLLIFAPLA